MVEPAIKMLFDYSATPPSLGYALLKQRVLE
jgi:hypothetical protein